MIQIIGIGDELATLIKELNQKSLDEGGISVLPDDLQILYNSCLMSVIEEVILVNMNNMFTLEEYFDLVRDPLDSKVEAYIESYDDPEYEVQCMVEEFEALAAFDNCNTFVDKFNSYVVDDYNGCNRTGNNDCSYGVEEVIGYLSDTIMTVIMDVLENANVERRLKRLYRMYSRSKGLSTVTLFDCEIDTKSNVLKFSSS